MRYIPNINRTKERLEKNTKTISFFGRPEIRKGLHIFERIVEIMHEKGIEFQALYVGPNIVIKDIEDCEGKKQTLCIEEKDSSYHRYYYELYENGRTVDSEILEKMFAVSEAAGGYTSRDFQDHLRRMYDYYLASDVIIIPSIYETFGYVALEAMACRRPVIASNIGGLKELLSDGRGTLIDLNVGDDGGQMESIAQEFASSAIKILNNGAVEQIAKAKAWVELEYSKERMRKMLEELYDCYLESIIHGREKAQRDPKIDHVMRDHFAGVDDWEALLTKVPDAYQEIRKKLYPSSKENSEFYDLFWNIAYWLKANKSMCPEVSFMPIRELAELITEVTRFLPEEKP